MNNYSKKAYSDIVYVLSTLDDIYINKLPKKLITFFNTNRDPFYISNIDMSKPLNEQSLLRETEEIICLLNLNYWCTPEEKKKLLEKYKSNEKDYQKELENKYAVNFNNHTRFTNAIQEKNTSLLALEKNNIIKKILNFLKSFFIKHK